MKIARLSDFVCGGLMVVGALYVLCSGVFSSVKDLEEKLMAFISKHNVEPTERGTGI